MPSTRIPTRPGVCTGKPSSGGLRFPVSRLLELPASSQSHEDIPHPYPCLEAADIDEALRYVAHLRKTKPSSSSVEGPRRHARDAAGGHPSPQGFLADHEGRAQGMLAPGRLFVCLLLLRAWIVGTPAGQGRGVARAAAPASAGLPAEHGVAMPLEELRARPGLGPLRDPDGLAGELPVVLAVVEVGLEPPAHEEAELP